MHFEVKIFFFYLRLPYEWKTPFRYLITMIFEFAGFFATVSAVVPTLSFFIGSCWLLTSIAKDIPTDLSFLAVTHDTHSDISLVTIYQRFFTALQCFSDVKQLSSLLQSSVYILALQFIDSLFLDWSMILKEFINLSSLPYSYGQFRIIVVLCWRYNFN